MASLRRAFDRAGAFSGWHLGHDEIRVHGWDQAPTAGGGSPGENLAENVRRLQAEAAALDPEAELTIWSDMFDPTHNAVAGRPYYLVNGDFAGSWLGLGPAVSIVNWHGFPQDRRAAAEHFAARGHRQILAGYYDQAPGAFRDRAWLAELAGVPGVDGVMYTPWSTGFDRLEAWADHVWGDAAWEPVPGGPPATVAATPTTLATAGTPAPTETRAAPTAAATLATPPARFVPYAASGRG